MNPYMARDGYELLPELLTTKEIERTHEAFWRIYEGKFDQAFWPREWYWRKGVIAEGVTGHASGVWRADSGIAQVTLDAGLARLVRNIMGWDSIRLAYDTLWFKPAGGSAVTYHQDDSYVGDYFGTESATLWIPLDRITADNGGIEYVDGSHKLPRVPINTAFHGVRDTYRSPYLNLYPDGNEPTVITHMPAGCATIHNGQTWHGSAPNQTDSPRRAFAIHYVPGHTSHIARQGYVWETDADGKISDQHHPVLA